MASPATCTSLLPFLHGCPCSSSASFLRQPAGERGFEHGLLSLQTFEAAHPPPSFPAADDDSAKQRREHVNKLMALGRAFGFLEETLHDAVQLWDRVLDLKPAAAEGDWGTVAAAVLLIAAQQGVLRVLPQSPAPCIMASPVLASRATGAAVVLVGFHQGALTCSRQVYGLSISLGESFFCGLVHTR